MSMQSQYQVLSDDLEVVLAALLRHQGTWVELGWRWPHDEDFSEVRKRNKKTFDDACAMLNLMGIPFQTRLNNNYNIKVDPV